MVTDSEFSLKHLCGSWRCEILNLMFYLPVSPLSWLCWTVLSASPSWRQVGEDGCCGALKALRSISISVDEAYCLAGAPSCPCCDLTSCSLTASAAQRIDVINFKNSWGWAIWDLQMWKWFSSTYRLLFLCFLVLFFLGLIFCSVPTRFSFKDLLSPVYTAPWCFF